MVNGNYLPKAIDIFTYYTAFNLVFSKHNLKSIKVSPFHWLLEVYLSILISKLYVVVGLYYLSLIS